MLLTKAAHYTVVSALTMRRLFALALCLATMAVAFLASIVSGFGVFGFHLILLVQEQLGIRNFVIICGVGFTLMIAFIHRIDESEHRIAE